MTKTRDDGVVPIAVPIADPVRNLPQSAIVIEYLQNMHKAHGAFKFTRDNVLDGIGHRASPGAVSGTVHRLSLEKCVIFVGMVQGKAGKSAYQYETTDDILNASSRNTRSSGGKVGRITNGKTNTEKLVNILFGVIEELEKTKTGLADYSTDELLRELKRRTEG